MDESLSGMSGWGIARRLLDHWDCPEELTEGERGLLEELDVYKRQVQTPMRPTRWE